MNRRTFLRKAPMALVALPLAACGEAEEEYPDLLARAEPPMILTMPNDITVEELERNRQWIKEQYAHMDATPIILETSNATIIRRGA